MSVILVIFLVVLASGFLGLLAVSLGSSPLAPAARILLAMTCGGLALFCVYGFIASFEPTEGAHWFKAGYAIGFLVLVTLAAWALLTRSSPAED